MASTALSPPQCNVVEAVVGAGRVMVAVAGRSLEVTGDEVTLAQYRVLVVLSSKGPQRLADLAAELVVNPSTATRLCDRLVAKKLIRRHRLAQDRRTIRVVVTDTGRQLVRDVTKRRRDEVRKILRKVPADVQDQLIAALSTFTAAAGDVPEQDWSLGWPE